MVDFQGDPAVPSTLVIFRLGWGLAKWKGLNAGHRPGDRWDPSSKILMFELGGTWRRIKAMTGVLSLSTTSSRATCDTATAATVGPRQRPARVSGPSLDSTIEQLKPKRKGGIKND
jgi:hypothetical protein